jgi:hypothetical protein
MARLRTKDSTRIMGDLKQYPNELKLWNRMCRENKGTTVPGIIGILLRAYYSPKLTS